MTLEMMGDIAKGSITDVKNSPMDVFKLSGELKQAVYILNRNNVAGVVLDKDLYEKMAQTIEELEEKLHDAEVFKRIQKHDAQENPVTYSLEEAGIDLSNVDYSEDDGWE